MSWDYGNARVSALRGRLLDPVALRRIASASSASAILDVLHGQEDWRSIVREALTTERDKTTAARVAVERHLGLRLGRLPTFFPSPERELVEALVLPLDRERILDLVARRRAAEGVEAVEASIVPGALVGSAELAVLARAETLATFARGLVPLGLLLAVDALRVAELPLDPPAETVDAILLEGMESARAARVRGHDREAMRVTAIVEAERADLEAVRRAREAHLPQADLIRRATVLARLDRLAREDRADPTGVGTAAGHVAGLEAEALRLRTRLGELAERAHSTV